MPEISGSTQILPVIGRPTPQVKAPHFFNAYFARQDIDTVCHAMELSDDAADQLLELLRGWTNAPGIIATIPHKARAAAACDELSERAAALGVANLVRREADGRLVGDMSDGEGCVQAMRDHGVDPSGKRALVVGVGGAGSAIAYALAEAGVSTLCVRDLDSDRAEKLARMLRGRFPAIAISTDAPDMAALDIAVNGSPVGMNGDPNLPMSLDGIPSTAIVCDAVTAPEQTPWLKAAAQLGCKTSTGNDMVRGHFPILCSHFGFKPD
ncbi:MAG: shikimate dehydrogenase [Alphaproteobacteria bacterium]|jgi:shikimate dehydrogenase|nr:shikimate dehydrogenase [Alphaproteobacteria bacterium]